MYEGGFRASKPHGRGSFRWADGEVFHGYFMKGMRHGEGCESLVKGGWVMGCWQQGALRGAPRRVALGDNALGDFLDATFRYQRMWREKLSLGYLSFQGDDRSEISSARSSLSVSFKGEESIDSKTQTSENNVRTELSLSRDKSTSVPLQRNSENEVIQTSGKQQKTNEEFRALAKRASIGRLIGKGSYGCVYEAVLPTGVITAVKIIDVGSLEDAESDLRTLRNEISLLQRLQHKNIVRLEGYVEDMEAGRICIFMEHVMGGNLRSFIKKFTQLSLDVIRAWLRQIVEGVQYLHENNIVHRDLKGENILVGTNGVIKLADFGCSRSIETLCNKSHGCRSMVGTPYWMAPEVIKEDSGGYGAKADIWSVGCTLVEMLTGKPPWPEFSSMWSAVYHIANSAGLPSQMPSDLDPQVTDFLSLCFERDPMRRPSAAELLQHSWLKEFE